MFNVWKWFVQIPKQWKHVKKKNVRWKSSAILDSSLSIFQIIDYLCINKSRPLPIRLAYPAGHFFMEVRYTHQAITTEQQIDILKERGLLIDDVEQAIDVLDTISYFRLAGYWRHFETDIFCLRNLEWYQDARTVRPYLWSSLINASFRCKGKSYRAGRAPGR